MSKGTSIHVNLKDYSKEVLKALSDQIELGMKAIGSEAEGYAKKECPVDTGRLRNSISFATQTGHDGAGPDGTPLGTPEKNAVYVGSNVEYAASMEYGDYKHKVGNAHFLRNSMTNHVDRYKALLEAALKGY